MTETSANILLAEDEPSLRAGLTKVLENRGYRVRIAEDGNAAIRALHEDEFDVVITDLFMPGADGLAVVRRVRELAPQTMVLLLTGHGSVESAVEALREGVVDYVQKPVRFTEVVDRLERMLEWRDLSLRTQSLRRQVNTRTELAPFFVSRSAAMQRILALISQVAPTNSTVLITGESGVGKEIVARAIHHLSQIPEKLFLPINCGAIPEHLLESQLFGHSKGSFTGADATQEGLIHRARGGTMFLDEIGEMPLALQVKLLRVIEQKEILPIGAPAPVSVDVRIIASTNRDLRKAIEQGRFREDLYYRLNVVSIEVPPLRDRREDIPPLAEHLVARHNATLKRNYKGVDNATMKLLMGLQWRGNVRELNHAIEYAMIVGNGEWVGARDLPPGIAPLPDDAAPTQEDKLVDAVRLFEKAHIQNVLVRNSNDRRKAAEQLGIDLSTLYRKIRDLQIGS